MWKDPQGHHSSYATDMVAWNFLLGKPFGGGVDTAYPTGHVRWGLAGTADAATSLISTVMALRLLWRSSAARNSGLYIVHLLIFPSRTSTPFSIRTPSNWIESHPRQMRVWKQWS